MRQEAINCLLQMEDFTVMGFSDVLHALPKLRRQFHQIKEAILHKRPAAVILIDYPGFNLRLASHLRKGGFTGKIIQYICPSVWAHGKKRIDQMVRTLDLLMTIYPFEQNYFQETPLRVRYVGNPLQESLSQYTYTNEWHIPQSEEIVAIFPGSRQGEIQRNLPTLLQTAERMKKKYPETIFAVSCSDESLKSTILSHLQKSSLHSSKDVVLIPKESRYALMHRCRSALAKSGTITLELALHKKPTVVIYKLSFLNWFIAKFWLRLKLPYFSMPNILANQEVFPEFIKKPFTSEMVFEALESLHTDGIRREQCLSACEEIKRMLGTFPTSVQAAQEIKDVLQ